MSAQLCEEQKDLGSGDAFPISAVELQNNKQFKGAGICSEIKGQEQYIQLVKKRTKLLPITCWIW